MSDTLNRGRKALERIHQRNEDAQWTFATVGRLIAGVPVFDVTGKPNDILVTIRQSSGAQTSVNARNDANVPRALGLPVRLRKEVYANGQFIYIIDSIARRSDLAYSSPGQGPNIHTHHNLYFQKTEHIAVSAGAADAGKPIKLGGAGKIDLSMITGVILADGTVILTGDWDIGEDRRIKAEALRARDAEGFKLEDDGVNGYIHLIDGGETKLRRDSAGVLLNLGDLSITEGGTLLQTGFIRTSSDNDINFTIVRTLAGVGFMGAGVNGDTFRRLLIYADGKIEVGDGASARDVNFYRSAANLWRTDDSMIIVGTLGVGIAPAVTQIHTVVSDAVTNAIVNVLTMGHLSSGTPAAGFGAGVIAQLESSTTTHQDAGRLTWEWVTATHASRASKGKLSAYLIAAEVIGLTWDSAGLVQVPGTLNVVGAVDLDSTLNVDGTANIEGATVVDDTLNVTGAVDFDSTLNVDGAATFNAAVTVKPGAAADTVKVGGILFTSTTAVGNVGTGEDDLVNVSVPANILSVTNMSVWMKASGKCANNANTKRLRIRFGAAGVNLILDDSSFDVSVVINWEIEVHVYRTGAATQKAHARLMYTNVGLTSPGGQVAVVTTLDQTLSSAVEFKLTGEATSTNDITVETVKVGWDAENS